MESPSLVSLVDACFLNSTSCKVCLSVQVRCPCVLPIAVVLFIDIILKLFNSLTTPHIYVPEGLSWARDQGIATTRRTYEKAITNVHSIQQDCTAQNWGEEDTERRIDRYDGFTLKNKIRDSMTDETPQPHSSTRLFLALVAQCKRLVPSLRHRGILSRQGYTPMKDTHPFDRTPVQLHTHKFAHSFGCTPVPEVQHCSCQNITRLTALTVNPNWQKFIFRKREKAKAFFFL